MTTSTRLAAAAAIARAEFARALRHPAFAGGTALAAALPAGIAAAYASIYRSGAERGAPDPRYLLAGPFLVQLVLLGLTAVPLACVAGTRDARPEVEAVLAARGLRRGEVIGGRFAGQFAALYAASVAATFVLAAIAALGKLPFPLPALAQGQCGAAPPALAFALALALAIGYAWRRPVVAGLAAAAVWLSLQALALQLPAALLAPLDVTGWLTAPAYSLLVPRGPSAAWIAQRLGTAAAAGALAALCVRSRRAAAVAVLAAIGAGAGFAPELLAQRAAERRAALWDAQRREAAAVPAPMLRGMQALVTIGGSGTVAVEVALDLAPPPGARRTRFTLNPGLAFERATWRGGAAAAIETHGAERIVDLPQGGATTLEFVARGVIVPDFDAARTPRAARATRLFRRATHLALIDRTGAWLLADSAWLPLGAPGAFTLDLTVDLPQGWCVDSVGKAVFLPGAPAGRARWHFAPADAVDRAALQAGDCLAAPIDFPDGAYPAAPGLVLTREDTIGAANDAVERMLARRALVDRRVPVGPDAAALDLLLEVLGRHPGSLGGDDATWAEAARTPLVALDPRDVPATLRAGAAAISLEAAGPPLLPILRAIPGGGTIDRVQLAAALGPERARLLDAWLDRPGLVPAPVPEALVLDDLDPGFAVTDADGADPRIAPLLPDWRGGRAPREWVRAALHDTWGAYRHTAAMVEVKQGRAATFRGQLPAAGRYRVALRVPPRDPGEPLLAPRVVLQHRRGTWSVTIDGPNCRAASAFDADAAVPGWAPVATLACGAGEVAVTLRGASREGLLVADAVQWSEDLQ